MSTTSSVAKVGGGLALACGLGLVAWRLMAVSTGELPTDPGRAPVDPPVAEVATDPSLYVAPPSAPAAPKAPPDPAQYVPPVLNADDPPPPGAASATEAVEGAFQVKAAVEDADAAFDQVLKLLPPDAKGPGLQVMETSRTTLDKLSYNTATGQIPMDAALAAVKHQRKVVARRLAVMVEPEVADQVNRALGVGVDDAP